MPSEKIMIVDDERLVRWSLRQKCEEWGYHVIEADSGVPGLKLAEKESPDLVLLDVRMPDLTGIEVLDQLKKNGDARAVIMITADPQLDDVKAALKLGAYDFVGKPVDFDELHVTIKNALEATSLRTEVKTLRSEVRRGAGYDSVVGTSPKMTELMNFVRKVASSAATTILIQGESGTGKDLIAKAIHYESSRQEKPFVAINCSAIPETLMEAELFGHEKGAFTDAKQMKKGLFEAADGGTLFLDEIGELSPLLASQTSARARRPGHPARRRHQGHAGRCPRHRRLQPRSRKSRSRKSIPPGSLLPPRHYRHLHPPAARSQAKTSCRWSNFSSTATTADSRNRSAASPTKPAVCILATTGPATFAN